MDKEKIAKLCNEIEDIVCDISQQTMYDIISAESRMIFDKAKEITAEISAQPKTNADLYDLLCDMNANFMSCEPHCVLEAITGANMICKHESCNHCIAEHIKQEVSEDADN